MSVAGPAVNSRRAFLRDSLQTGITAGCGLALISTACDSTAAPPSPPAFSADLRVVRLLASIELSMIDAYATTLIAAGAGGRVAPAPPAFLALAETARAHHDDHAASWNALLRANRQALQTAKDNAVTSLAQQRISQAQTVSDLAAVMQLMENTSLQSHVVWAQQLGDGAAREVAMRIAPVEAQHAAILTFLLGEYPVPSAATGTTLARGLADLGR